MSNPKKALDNSAHSGNGSLPNAIDELVSKSPDHVPSDHFPRASQKKEAFEMDGITSKPKDIPKISSGKLSADIKTTRSNDPPVEEPSKKAIGFRSLFRYPRGTYFCLGNEFSERFSFYGMKAILVIYLIKAHDLSSTTAKLVYHTFVFTAYFTPIFGSILSDGFFGRYRVILFVSIIYCLGHVLLTVSAVPSIGVEAMKALDFCGLFVIALATGGIKPCVSAFAADQFPETMAAERVQFFSFFYFMINLGALMSQVITPILRYQPCMGSDTCFPLAFGVPAIFMFLATILFWAGTPFYKISRVRDNVIWRVCQCVVYALKEKFRSGRKKMHWLDYALPKYDQTLVDDVKAMLNVMVLFVPVVLFWALFEQQGSTWVLQGNQMNGRVGRLTILPDQMGVLNPFLVILLIPLFEGLVYPTLAKCNIWTRQLRRMGWGGFLAALSFIVAGFLQLAVDKTTVTLPADGHSRLVVTSYLKCDALVIDGQNRNNFTVPAGAWKEGDLIPNVSVSVANAVDCGSWRSRNSHQIRNNASSGYFIALFDSSSSPLSTMSYDLEKTKNGKTRVYFLFESRAINGSYNLSISLEQDGKVEGLVEYTDRGGDQSRVDLEPDLLGSNEYKIYSEKCPNVDGGNCTKTFLKSFDAETGAAHVFVIPAEHEDTTNRLIQVIAPNSISILWQVPQYAIITVGEILFSISGLAFSYSQASPKMKSVFQAIWLLTSAFGNLIDMGLSGSGAFENKPALEFFVYGAIMGVIMVLFVVLAWRYKHSKSGGENY